MLDLAVDLDANRPLPGNDRCIVVRGNVGGVVLRGEATCLVLGMKTIVPDGADLRSVCTNCRKLGLVGIGRNKDGRLDSKRPCRACNSGAMIARGGCNDSSVMTRLVLKQHLVERPAQLERSRPLEILELQDDGTVCIIPQDRRDLRRCEPDMISNTCLGCLDLIR